MTTTSDMVQRLWHMCHVLRDDDISYHQYLSELTWLLFLKMTEETQTETLLLPGCRWADLKATDGLDQLNFYRAMLLRLGTESEGRVLAIYANANTSLRQPRNLATLVRAIDELDWNGAREEGLGDLFEELLERSANDLRSGVGQYSTPRVLIESMVDLVQPQPGETVSDPAAGTLGFITRADQYIRAHYDNLFALPEAAQVFPRTRAYYAVELSPDARRLALMNAMLRGIESDVLLGDTLSPLGKDLPASDVILSNPPIGRRSGTRGASRNDLPFPTNDMQLAFLQHIYRNLKPGGRAAVVLSDNALFADGVGQKVRVDLMKTCNLHTILRLPAGILRFSGVRTNVLFFSKGRRIATNEMGGGPANNQVRDICNTKAVWVYDLRTNLPAFDKRTPIARAHLADFEAAYGRDMYGKSDRVDEGETGRFRSFSRAEISARGDNLDLIWLRESNDTRVSTASKLWALRAGNPLRSVEAIQLVRPAPDFAYTGQPEPGVCEWGEDGYGRGRRGWFIGFRVGEVVQRMRWVPPGSFWMGSPDSDEQGFDDERPQREVALTQGYWLADTPVTQALWVAVMGENPSHFQDPKCPVERVSWDDTQTFLQRLNALHPWLNAVLPTEAQWEYACRADTTTQYWSGDAEADLARVGWYDQNSEGRTHPVAGGPPSPWGLHDMHGNVWEWCWDFLASYRGMLTLNPAGPEHGEGRVLRGGSWLYSARYARAADRLGNPPGARHRTLGFRITRGQPDQPGALGGGAEPRR